MMARVLGAAAAFYYTECQHQDVVITPCRHTRRYMPPSMPLLCHDYCCLILRDIDDAMPRLIAAYCRAMSLLRC